MVLNARNCAMDDGLGLGSVVALQPVLALLSLPIGTAVN